MAKFQVYQYLGRVSHYSGARMGVPRTNYVDVISIKKAAPSPLHQPCDTEYDSCTSPRL
jgi:hypothetical protein